MKKIKLLTVLSSLPILGIITMPLASCGNNNSQISKIEVTTKPTKLFYGVGQKLNLTGMVITATNIDGTTKDVTSQCTTNPDTNTPLTKNNNKVVVTHTASNKTCEFNIEVGNPEITSISLETLPTKVAYGVGQQLDLTGMVVKANWNDGRIPTDVTSECVTDPSTETPLTKDHKKVVVTHAPTGKTCEFNITVVDITFQNDTWTNVINYANQGLGKLKQVYGVSTFIGLERKVIINTHEHIVRVIGEEHDTIADTNTKVALTFELATLLSDADGNVMTTKWDSSRNYDYPNSILRKNLTGEGSASGEYIWNNNALSMLPSELKTGIKLVTKQVATKTGEANDYTVNSYNDKLFPLTYTEMTKTVSERAKEEGNTYQYWINYDSDQYRIKKDANGKSKHYWLTSPSIDLGNLSWCVDYGGTISSVGLAQTYGVSFGFCI